MIVLDRYTAKLMKLIADVQHTLRIGNRNEKFRSFQSKNLVHSS